MGIETIALVGAGLAAGVAASSMLASKPSAKTPEAPAPEKPPQQAKTPEIGGLRRQNAAAEGGPGMSSSATLLTGPSGVDNNLLSLGKATLLGQ